MITPALIAEEVKTQTYTQVARKYGVTKGVIAGRVRRHHHPLSPRPPRRPPPPRESMIEAAILELMADGRERTTSEIAASIGRYLDSTYQRLRKLRIAGVIAQTRAPYATEPAIWQEAPE
jgi:transposase